MFRSLLAILFVAMVTLPGAAQATTYWNLFNFEGESAETAVYATYATAADMFLDQNRTGFFTPTSPFFDRNIVGAGSDGFTVAPANVPEPASWLLMLIGFGAIGAGSRAGRCKIGRRLPAGALR